MEETGSPAHLRFLLRRLRQRAPAAYIVVAMWASEGGADWEEASVDSKATSLRQALSRCIDAAAAASAPSPRSPVLGDEMVGLPRAAGALQNNVA